MSVAHRQQKAAVGRKTSLTDARAKALQGVTFLAGIQVPNADRRERRPLAVAWRIIDWQPISADGDEGVTIGTELSVQDIAQDEIADWSIHLGHRLQDGGPPAGGAPKLDEPLTRHLTGPLHKSDYLPSLEAVNFPRRR